MYNRIAIATNNKGKVEAAKAALDNTPFVDSHREIFTHSVESGVSDSPLSDEEGITGCVNRIEAIKEIYPNVELYIALEGVLAQIGKNWFIRGWTVVEDTALQRTAIASGASVQIPESIISSIDSMDQFSETVKNTYAVTPDEASKIRDFGSNGVFSNGIYTRHNTFYDGVGICLASISNERNWQ